MKLEERKWFTKAESDGRERGTDWEAGILSGERGAFESHFRRKARDYLTNWFENQKTLSLVNPDRQ